MSDQFIKQDQDFQQVIVHQSVVESRRISNTLFETCMDGNDKSQTKQMLNDNTQDTLGDKYPIEDSQLESDNSQGGGSSIFRFFQYNTSKDNLMLFVGTMGAIIAGLLLPSISLIMGSIAGNFGDSGTTGSDMQDEITKLSKIVGLVSATIFVFSYIFFAFWQHLAENISMNLRKIYLKALLNQEIAYFEHIQIEQIPTQMGEIFETVQSSIGEKFSNLIFAVFTGIGGCIFAFITGRSYALALIAYLPVFFIILGVFGIMVKNITSAKIEINKEVGGIVSEILYAIKVVASHGTEAQEVEKFKNWTEKTRDVGYKFQTRFSFMVAIMKFAIFSFYTFSFYVGSLYIKNETPNPSNSDQINNPNYTAENVLTVLVALITGFISLIAALPNIQALQSAKVVGKIIFDVIDREPKIKDFDNAVQDFKLNDCIEFKNVSFKYPTAPREQKGTFDNVNFKINAGQSTAIVGPSGFGKSTIVQMIERFYDPTKSPDGKVGTITFDGQNIRGIKLKDLREGIGYVPQEPTLIIGTIRENLLFGNRDASDSELKIALKKANAQFVFDLERQLDTFIGTSSVVNLSGGQKQRLAIARALLKNPKILILDEATSALDPQSEKEVQNAIEQIQIDQSRGNTQSNKLTILIIAHRLSSIKSAQNILFIEARNKISSYKQGTNEYDRALEKLKNFTYTFKNFDEEEVEEEKIKSVYENSVISQSEASMVEAQDQAQIAHFGPIDLNQHKIDSSQMRDSSKTLPQKKRESELGISINEKKDADLVRDESQDQQIVQKVKQNFGQQSIISSRIDLALSGMQLDQSQPVYRSISGRDIMRYYSPTWLAVVGIFSSIGASAQLPVFGFLLSKMVFILMDTDKTDFQDKVNLQIILFGVLCSGIFIFTFIQKLAFGYCSENLTYSVRIQLFEAILFKHIGWFDNKDRAPGILGNTIQEDIAQLNGLTSETYAVALESILGLILSSALCLYFSWQVGLIAIILSPMMVFGGFFMSSFQWSQGKVDDCYRQSNALLSDIIMNYRTIISLGEKNVGFILEKYYKLLEEPNRQGIKRAHFSGLLFGYSQSIRFVFVALTFYFAAIVIEKGNMTGDQRQDVFTGVYIMFVGAIGAGVSVSQMPSISKAKNSARKVFGIIEEKSQIDPRAPTKLSEKENKITKGTIILKNVSFKYPSRNKKILDNFSLTIKGNESVALVGHSGSGKSTIASLLLRFYNKQSGRILIDGQEIEQYSVKQLREQVAIVMQEPLLFNESIDFNIRYGTENTSDSDVMQVAGQANCLQFIQSDVEQLNAPEIKAQILEGFQALIQNQKMKHKNLQLLEDLTKQEGTHIQKVFLLSQLLNSLNDKGLQLLDQNMKVFLDEIWKKLPDSDELQSFTWQQLIMSLAWKVIMKIKLLQKLLIYQKFFDSAQYASTVEFINSHEWKLDEQAIEDFCKQVEGQSKTVMDETVSIATFLRSYESFDRFQEDYTATLESLVDHQRQKNAPLHPGFNRLCGLRGARLSGGQKQRVAIARALIRNPRILILDEATSALDEKSQEIVQQALERAMKGRTSIVIAHRLSTVKRCDRIVVLNNGRVVEEGTYQDLSENPNSEFFKLKAGLQMKE